MKILYAIQGTGNGHLSRAIAILPKLKNRVQVDVLVSGIQSDIEFPFEVKYKLDGMSFIFGKKGDINYTETLKKVNFIQAFKDIKNCPVQEYDLVLNDFEPITAWACKLKNVPCVSLSHQAALLSPLSPRPKRKNLVFDIILKHYAPTKKQYSFHFEKYDKGIFFPIIRDQFRIAEIKTEPHYTVYLPAYSDEKIIKVLSEIKNVQWQVFSKHTKKNYFFNNVEIHKINLASFEKSITSCSGVICGAGFETPSEALYLGKKLLVIPMKGQYEQQCNAQSLKKMGVKVLKKFNLKKVEKIKNWILFNEAIEIKYPDEIQYVVDQILIDYLELNSSVYNKLQQAAVY